MACDRKINAFLPAHFYYNNFSNACVRVCVFSMRWNDSTRKEDLYANERSPDMKKTLGSKRYHFFQLQNTRRYFDRHKSRCK